MIKKEFFIDSVSTHTRNIKSRLPRFVCLKRASKCLLFDRKKRKDWRWVNSHVTGVTFFRISNFFRQRWRNSSFFSRNSRGLVPASLALGSCTFFFNFFESEMLAAFWALLGCVFGLLGLALFPRSKKKRLGGPRSWPVIGNLHELADRGGPFEAFTRLAKIYGDIFEMKLGVCKCVVVSSYGLVKEVLITRGGQFGGRPDFLRFHSLFGGDRNNCEFWDQSR